MRSCITCGEEIEDSRPQCYKCNKATTQKGRETKRLKEESGEIKKKLKNTTAPIALPCEECKESAEKNRNAPSSPDDGWSDYYDYVDRIYPHNHSRSGNN